MANAIIVCTFTTQRLASGTCALLDITDDEVRALREAMADYVEKHCDRSCVDVPMPEGMDPLDWVERCEQARERTGTALGLYRELRKLP